MLIPRDCQPYVRLVRDTTSAFICTEWCARLDGYDAERRDPVGHGATWGEALDDLIEQLEDMQ